MANTEVTQHPGAVEMQEIYELTLAVVVNLTEDQFRWQEKPTAPSIRFHLFHIARWADHLQMLINGAAEDIWDAEQIAAQWGLDPETLGYGQSGAMIDDEVAMNLPCQTRTYCSNTRDVCLGLRTPPWRRSTGNDLNGRVRSHSRMAKKSPSKKISSTSSPIRVVTSG